MESLPLQGRLVVHKLVKNGMSVEELTQNIKKCKESKSEVTKMHFEARKYIQGMKSDLEVSLLPDLIRKLRYN